MIVIFKVLWCSSCNKDRLHECMGDFGKCVKCSYVRDSEKEIAFVD